MTLVVVIIAILYYATPNVQQPKFRWMSAGAFIALIVWAVASALFGFYVANFGNYNKTYGALAGVVVFLLWLWITNLPCCSAPSSTRRWNAAVSCRPSCPPRSSCSSRHGTPGRSRSRRRRRPKSSRRAAGCARPAGAAPSNPRAP